MNEKSKNKGNNLLIIIKLFSLSMIVLMSCNTSKGVSDGAFIGKANPIQEILIKGDSFAFIQDNRDKRFDRGYFCCDTLSYGVLKKEKGGFIELTTPVQFDSSLEMIVKEKINGDVKDSFLINISTTIDNTSTGKKLFTNGEVEDVKGKFLKYDILINEIYSFALNQQESSFIKISPEDVENENIENISIIVSIDSCKDVPISFKGIEGIIIKPYPYKLKNQESNELDISIPDLNYEYLNFKRLNRDYLKIKNKNTLIWDGEEYIRKN